MGLHGDAWKVRVSAAPERGRATDAVVGLIAEHLRLPRTAVSVVSGHIRGVTNTLPLHVEILYNEYDFTGAFAVASLLTFLALVTLAARKLEEARVKTA